MAIEETWTYSYTGRKTLKVREKKMGHASLFFISHCHTLILSKCHNYMKILNTPLSSAKIRIGLEQTQQFRTIQYEHNFKGATNKCHYKSSGPLLSRLFVTCQICANLTASNDTWINWRIITYFQIRKIYIQVLSGITTLFLFVCVASSLLERDTFRINMFSSSCF